MIKKCFIVCFLFLLVQAVFGQSNSSITLQLENNTLKEVIEKLESKTSYTFYFQENWFSDIALNKDYQDVNINTILNDLLKETTLNYYIQDNRIILTNNTVINEKLASGIFKQDSVNINTNNTILFYNKNEDAKKDISIIGKQTDNINKPFFTLSGYARNENTNDPIQNLIISIADKDIRVTTNSKGFYSIEVPAGFNTIETQLFGFEETLNDVMVYNNGSLNLSIPEVAETLDEVVIDAKKDANIKEAVVGVTTIDVVGLKTIPVVLGERDVLRVATSLPGIKTAGEGSSGFNVRGGRTDQNLILLDDAVIYSPSHFLGFFTALNPFTTGSVNIYKGSIPAEFGGRLSSVFDIKTKTGNVEKFSGEGSIGPVTANLALEVPIVKEKSSLITGFRSTYSNWILRAIDEEDLKNSEASFYDIIAKYKHNINENNDIQASVYYSKDKFSITSDSLFKYNNLATSLKWDHSFNNKHKSEVILVNSQYKFDIGFEGDANLNFDFGYKVNETQLKLNMKYLHSKKHKFDYGLSTKLYNINPGEIKPNGDHSDVEPLTIDKEKALESAIYIADKFEVNDKLLIDLGIRYSFYAALGASTQNVYANDGPRNESTVSEIRNYGKNEFIKTYGGPEYRVSLRYFLSPSFSLKGSFNKSIQYIHLLSNNTTEAPTDTWKLSDLNTSPQRATQFALGLYKNLDDSDIELSLEGYYKKMKDLLDYKIGANLNLNENIEQELLQGEGKAYGIELLIKKEKGKLNGWLAYSYSRSLVKLDSPIDEERVNDGKYFSANFDKPHDFSLIANYKLTHRYSISTNFTYQTGRPVTFPIAKYTFAGEEQVVYSDRNKFRIPDYYRLDIGLNIEGNHKIKKLAHSFWNISVYNVLGRNNPYSVFFVNENGKIQAYKTSIFAVPIPTITYNFKF
ncbi:carboxypeptidase-like regulatory domain-containing protein [Lacinutrix iliipiscaria]|uniref:Carboxypeptidase-like regulatory domain-containing protein n=1 Tax=Lacinutrix iliipiscaria TaxID=1230532 RepID=A0ABW5WN37_9FLAO